MTTTAISPPVLSIAATGSTWPRKATPSSSPRTSSSVPTSMESAPQAAALSSITATSSVRIPASASIQGSIPCDFSDVWVASQGIVEAAFGFGIEIDAGSFTIQNYGQVTGDAAVLTEGAGTVLNYGTMSGQDFGVFDGDVVATDQYHLQNYGTINAPGGAGIAFQGRTDIELILNSGKMVGDVFLSSGAHDIFNSTLGTVDGTINAGSGGDTIIAGQSGGLVVGGALNDILRANPTQTAANNAAQTTLDGGHGNNVLYGDGAFTTFLAGDTGEATIRSWAGCPR